MLINTLLALAVAGCPFDTNEDLVIDINDLIAIIIAWETADPAADVSGDGIVDIQDFILVVTNWGLPAECLDNGVPFCPYGNEAASFATCDFRLAHQDRYVDEAIIPLDDLETAYGVTNRAWAVSGTHVLAGPEQGIAAFLGHTESEIQARFEQYLKARPLAPDTTDLILLNIADPVAPDEIGGFVGGLQTQVIEAFKRRIQVVRAALPQARLGLLRTPKPDAAGDPDDPGFQQSLAGLQTAAGQGLFDDLDCLMPLLFTRFGEGDQAVATLEAYVRQGIETGASLTDSGGGSLPLVPVLSFVVANGSSQHSDQTISAPIAQQYVSIVQEYPEVQTVVYWSTSSEYHNDPDANPIDVLGFYQAVKPAPALCFCESDVDDDGVHHVVDNCPYNFNSDQADGDDDGIGDFCDNCPDHADPDLTDIDHDGAGNPCDPDDENDGVLDDGDGSGIIGDNPCTGPGDTHCDDNCRTAFNPQQEDQDGDGVGDACDLDIDGDGDPNEIDCAPLDPAVHSAAAENCADGEDNDCDGYVDGLDTECGADDIDGDGVPDDVDNCIFVANSDQDDLDGDGLGDLCDQDIDGDGDPNINDCEPLDPGAHAFGTEICDDGVDNDCDGFTDATDIDCGAPDADGDDVPDAGDNCPVTFNPNQIDSDDDAVGDECDAVPKGQSCPGDANGDGTVDQDDFDLVLAGLGLPCKIPCLGDVDGNGAVDVQDLNIVTIHWGDC